MLQYSVPPPLPKRSVNVSERLQIPCTRLLNRPTHYRRIPSRRLLQLGDVVMESTRQSTAAFGLRAAPARRRSAAFFVDYVFQR